MNYPNNLEELLVYNGWKAGLQREWACWEIEKLRIRSHRERAIKYKKHDEVKAFVKEMKEIDVLRAGIKKQLNDIKNADRVESSLYRGILRLRDGSVVDMPVFDNMKDCLRERNKQQSRALRAKLMDGNSPQFNRLSIRDMAIRQPKKTPM